MTSTREPTPRAGQTAALPELPHKPDHLGGPTDSTGAEKHFVIKAPQGGPGGNVQKSNTSSVTTATLNVSLGADAPGLAAVGNSFMLFAKTSDGRIFSNRCVLGQNLQGWTEVDGGGRTGASPAAAAIGKLHVRRSQRTRRERLDQPSRMTCGVPEVGLSL